MDDGGYGSTVFYDLSGFGSFHSVSLSPGGSRVVGQQWVGLRALVSRVLVASWRSSWCSSSASLVVETLWTLLAGLSPFVFSVILAVCLRVSALRLPLRPGFRGFG